ncbi:MAG: glycosyltransferase family 4 protein [archaeon]|nr:MAG: glycosyltransferase family 4 protein [archaeon]
MKIGLVSDAIDLKRKTGISFYVYHLIKNILNLNKKNQFFLLHSEKNDEKLYKKAKEVIIPYSLFGKKTSLRNLFHLSKFVKRLNLDILHEFNVFMPFMVKNNTKRIMTVYDLSPIVLPHTHLKRSSIYYRLFLKRVLRKANAIIAISQNTKRDLIRYFRIHGKKVYVIYPGRDESFKIIKNKNIKEKIKKKYNLPDKFILDVSTIEPRKNLSCLIKAYSLISDKIDEKLVIVGGYGWRNEKERVDKLIKKLKIRDKVKIIGYAEGKDMPMIFNLCEIFVFTSIYEGFGLPLLEAMACGKPVLCGKNSSLKEVVGNAGLEINEKNPKDVANKIEKILKSSKMRKELSKKSLKQSKKFSWKKSALELLKIYSSI